MLQKTRRRKMITQHHKLSALLTGIILYIPFLCSMLLHVWQHWHQHEQDSFSLRHSITTIQLPAHQLQWERKGKELLVNGKHFDVMSFKQVNGIVHITGHYDDKEDFFTQAFSFFQNNKQTQQENPSVLLQLQWCSFFVSLPPVCEVTEWPVFILPLTTQVYDAQVYTSPYSEVPVAPPWI